MLNKILKILILSILPLFEFEPEDDDTIWDDDTILM